MVAMFSEELSSWASASIRPEASTLSLVPVATQPASPRPQPRRQFQLQSQPFQLQPQPPADEAKKSLARELFLQKDRRPSPKRDAERDDFDRLFSTSSSLYSGMRALSLMSVASSQTRTSEYSSLFDSPPLLDPSVDPSSSSQTHDTLSSFNTSHEYNLTSRGRDYATVVVVSRAGNVLDPPQLHFGDQLKGCIVMHRDNLSDMRSMEVMLFESDPVTPSCEIKRTLSPQEVDESRISGGHFSWPFVITPPSVLSSIAAPASARTDPSITHHSSGDHFIRPRTQLMVIIYRTGGRLTRNVGLRQPIYYIPPPTPGTPSPPSQIPTSIPPDFPVDSWPEQKLPDVIMRGIIFRKLQVEVTCKLIVPVSHPVSDAIPLRLIMTCESREALDLLAISYAIDVRLLKVLAIGNNATSISPLTLRRPFSCHRTDWAAIAQWEANSHCSELPPSDEHPKTRWRVELNGMLHRNESVQITESFEQQGKALMYFVCLFPFKLADFRPAHDRNKELLMVKLPITK
ncbi:hypothetical protein H4582DRAFT_1535517 [Lactarius indigo]|nr:hypothetical protein H4582DRAFT_1535517 [Lactarius indigo]